MNRTTLFAGLVVVAALGSAAEAQTADPLPSGRLGEALSDLPERSGPAPSTTFGIPHVQNDQNAPVAMQQLLKDAIGTLDGVTFWNTPYSLGGSIGWLLPEELRKGPEQAYSSEGEFGHSHRPQDGSMHLRLPADVARSVLDKGWGVIHPLSSSIAGESGLGYVMIFGPRNGEELDAVWVIVQAAYATARGLDMDAATFIEPATWGQTKESGSR